MTAAEEREVRSTTPPTMSPVTFANFVDTHRRTLPGRIDKSLMKSIAGGDQPRILAALEFTALTTVGGRPTGRFENMRAADEQEMKKLWLEVLQSSYPTMFDGFDLSTATQSQIEERLKDAFAISGDTVRKAVAFFLALARNADVQLSPYVKQTRTRSPRTPGSGPKRTKQVRKFRPDRDVTDNAPGQQKSQYEAKFAQLHPSLEHWIAEIPAHGQDWKRDDFDGWLMIFKQMVERLYKIP